MNTPFRLTKQSLSIISKKKSLLIFSLCAIIINLSLFMLVIRPFFTIEFTAWTTNHIAASTYIIFFAALLVVFMMMNTVSLFFTSVLTYCAINHIQQKPYSFTMGIKTAFIFLPKLYRWELMMTTLGPIIRLLESWSDTWPQRNFAVNTLHRLRWKMAVFFMIPTIITEENNILPTIKRSAALVYNNWGAARTTNISMSGIFFGLRMLALLPVLIGTLIGGKIVITISAAIAIALFLTISIIYSTSIHIIVSALYLHAMGLNTSPYFDTSLLKHTFK